MKFSFSLHSNGKTEGQECKIPISNIYICKKRIGNESITYNLTFNENIFIFTFRNLIINTTRKIYDISDKKRGRDIVREQKNQGITRYFMRMNGSFT